MNGVQKIAKINNNKKQQQQQQQQQNKKQKSKTKANLFTLYERPK
jgi:DNA replication protein DnaD